MAWLKKYRYKNLTLVFLSIVITLILSRFNFINDYLYQIKDLPFLGSFLAGALYVSATSAAFGILLLSDLAKETSALEIALFAGLGGAVADFAIFRFIKQNLISEISPIYDKLGGQHIANFIYQKYMRWTLPIIGAIIIASPLPDEIGIGLMGLSKIKNYQFALLCLVLDVIGVYLLVSAFSLVK